MAIKKLVEVWDGKQLIKENIIFLKNNTKEIKLPISKELEQIKIDLLDTYRAIPCAGIAANQIGYNKRIFIGLKHDEYDEENHKEINGNPNSDNFEFYINPRIDYFSKKSIQEGEEGCLSIPEIRLIAERYDQIKVIYFNGRGKKIKKPLSGFMSRLFQHELDHLNGKLMVENKKIKQIYKISENESIEKLYPILVQKILDIK
tara:strand:+ start:288 stop:896 length:609 start_codon:yes stop_codon:yes gene_type:complete